VIKRTPWQIQRAVIFALLMREIKTRFGGHWTGVVWMIGSPMLHMSAMVIMNVFVRGRIGGFTYDFVIYLFVALMPFRMCSSLWHTLMAAGESNRSLFSYRQIKPFDTLLARAILEVLLSFIIFSIYILLLDRIGFRPTYPDELLKYFSAWFGFAILGCSLGLVLAMIGGLVPRLSVFMGMTSMPLMILSGVIFPLHNLPSRYLDWIVMFNPLLNLVELARSSYIAGYKPIPGVSAAVPFYYTIGFLTLGMCLYRIRREKIISGD